MDNKKIKKVANKKIDNKKEKKNNNSKKTHKMKEELVNLLLKLLINVKIYHWKTKSYAIHKATDNLYETLNENIDRFVEILLGKEESRLNMKGKNIEILDCVSIEDFKKIIYDYRILFEKKINKYLIIESDTDLLTVRDEILGDLNQFLYLSTFK
jgi:DNA-binding ferritin-like protein